MPINRFPIQLRFGDEDSNGHVNNVRFVQFLEEARVRLGLMPLGEELFPEAGGQSFRSLTSRAGMAVVARQEIEYRSPLVYRQEPVWVDIWVTGIGSSSLTYGFRIADDDGGRVYAYAQSTLVMADAESGRPQQLSDLQIRVLESWRGEPVPFRGGNAVPDRTGAAEPSGANR
ncbi:thioesterase family protein [Arthrobacter sp. zg-Y1219]|uniref:acyl-CoA thioesterase n=1 Tax=Arthrobacter sp. zg-Y1219 TaxID=3049067 RepID=UPI0024C365E3|nr:thioesterase family protein [Arthrobacter sp. zg-Y1219]MDK1359220.1 thioesterase family protein [Arthrobacter sp. zg-Y1219]